MDQEELQDFFKANWIAIVGGFLAIVAVAIATTFFFVSRQSEVKLESEEADPVFDSLHFDPNLAIEVCSERAKQEFGKELVRTFDVQHSTRFDETQKIYLVTLEAHVGNAQLYDTAVVICRVNPQDYILKYYKATFESKRQKLRKFGN